jgi:uncharacterized membrane protein YoaK (UPF0700 family)
MAELSNVVIAALIVVVLFGVLRSIRVKMWKYADNHGWLYVVVAFALVIWAVLLATGVVHESPDSAVRTYVGGALGVGALIVLTVSARSNRR